MGNKQIHSHSQISHANTRLYILEQIKRVPLRSLHYCIKNSFSYTNSYFFLIFRKYDIWNRYIKRDHCLNRQFPSRKSIDI